MTTITEKRLETLRDPRNYTTLVFYRGERVWLLRRPDLLEAAEVAMAELHLTNSPADENLQTRPRKYLLKIIEIAAQSSQKTFKNTIK